MASCISLYIYASGYAQRRLRSSRQRCCCSIMFPPPHKDTLPDSESATTLPVAAVFGPSLQPAAGKVRSLLQLLLALGLESNCHNFILALVVPSSPSRPPPPAATYVHNNARALLGFTFGVPGNPHTADCQRPKQIINFAQDSTCALTLPTYGVTHRSCAGIRPPSPTGNALLQLQANLPLCVGRDIRSSSADLSALKKAVSRCRGATAADSPPSAAACRR